MDEKTKQILNDLYMIDGSLKKHEKEVTEIVNKLLESKPDIKVDGNFVRELRMELVKRAKVMNAIEPAKQGFWTSVISGQACLFAYSRRYGSCRHCFSILFLRSNGK